MGKPQVDSIKRALISLVVFAVIFWGFSLVIASPTYNVYVEAIKFLTAVIGAGCYWIGSNPR